MVVSENAQSIYRAGCMPGDHAAGAAARSRCQRSGFRCSTEASRRRIVWRQCGRMVLTEYVPHLKATDYHAVAVEKLGRRDARGVAKAIRDDIVEAGKYIDGLLMEEAAGNTKRADA